MRGRFRGQPALNKQLFAQYTSAISRIMAECPQVSEIDINPLIQSHDGSMTAVDSVFKLKKWCVCFKQERGGNRIQNE